MNTDPSTEEKAAVRLREERLWWVFAGALVLLAALIYAPVRHFGFINMDDPLVLKDNPWMALGLQWRSIRWAFLANLTEYSEQAEYWSPLTLLSRLADAEFFGLRPGAFHVTSVVLHVLNAALVGGAFRMLTGQAKRAMVVALLFVVHPLHVEPVCWLSARKDVLNATFLLTTLLAYGWYARGPSWRRYGLVLAAYACCLMAKPMGVSVPFLLLVLDVWPLRRWGATEGVKAGWPRLAWEKAPLLVMAGLAALLAIKSQQGWGAISSAGVLPVALRVENAVVSYAIYLRRLFWPDDLAIYYPHPEHSLTVAQVAWCAALLIGVTVAAICTRRRAPYFLAGWLWFGLVLGPVIGLMQVGAQAMADRYMYMGGLGLLVAIVWAVAEWLPARWHAAAGAVAVAGFSVAAAQQALFWQDSQSVFTHAIAVTTRNSMADYSLGTAQAVEGPKHDARAHLRRALEISVRIEPAWETLGQVEEMLGHGKPALACYNNALRLQPGSLKVLWLKGLLHRKLNDPASAEAAFKRMQELAPNQPHSYLLLGKLYAETTRPAAAMTEWSAYLRRWPGDEKVKRQLADLEAVGM